jgi:hypothetical protein
MKVRVTSDDGVTTRPCTPSRSAGQGQRQVALDPVPRGYTTYKVEMPLVHLADEWRLSGFRKAA